MTPPRLGGWLRLWIILCVTYGGVVAMVTVLDTPSKAPPPTNAEFLRALSDESLKVIYRAIDKKPDPYADLIPPEKNRSKEKDVLWWKQDSLVIRTPEGLEYDLPADVTKAEKDRISGEYESMMAARSTDYRWSAIRSALVWWLVPCVLILCAGLAVRWVYRGFRGEHT